MTYTIDELLAAIAELRQASDEWKDFEVAYQGTARGNEYRSVAARKMADAADKLFGNEWTETSLETVTTLADEIVQLRTELADAQARIEAAAAIEEAFPAFGYPRLRTGRKRERDARTIPRGAGTGGRMNIIMLLDKHFPKTEHVVIELYPNQFPLKKLGRMAVFQTARFDHISKRGKVYELYDSTDGSDYPSGRATDYDFVSIYDISDADRIRAFMLEYVAVASDDDLHDDFWSLAGILGIRGSDE